MARRSICLLVCLVLLFSASGCASILEGDYLSVQPHQDVPDSSPNSDQIPEVGTYLTLKAAIEALVLEGKEYGIIRLADFTTDEIEAMSMACWEVKSTSPFGAYAVDHITHDYTKILNYYDMEVFISYRRSQSQIDSLLSLSTPSLVRATLRSAMRSSEDYLAISVSDSGIDEDFIAQYVQEYYYDNPAYILACPGLLLETYPDTGVKRILEVELQYPYMPEEMNRRIILLNQEGRLLLTGILRENDAGYALDICRALAERTDFVAMPQNEGYPDRTRSVFTAYGAMMDQNANPEGYAMAYKLLCDLAGIECRVVLGRLNGTEHAWNIICLDGDWYHVDPSMCDEMGFGENFLRTDAQMWNQYWWDSESYPACTGSLNYYVLTGETPVLPETETETEDPEETPPEESEEIPEISEEGA